MTSSSLRKSNNISRQKRRRSWIHNAVICLFAAVVAVFMVLLPAHGPTSLLRWSSIMVDTNGQHPPHDTEKFTIPTLLSVFDDKTGQYISALENPLYESLRNGSLMYNGAKEDKISSPELLQLDKTEISMRDSLTLTWTVAQDDDVVLLFCSGSEQFLDAATVAQAKATSKKHSSSESMSEYSWHFPQFPVQRREQCHFELFRPTLKDSEDSDGKTTTPTIYTFLARSDTVKIRDAISAPTAIHLSFTNQIDEMVVQFKTGNKGTPMVKYGLDQDSLLFTAKGTSHTYGAEDMCQKPATKEEAGKFQPPGMLHVVRLTHLVEPNTTYYYQAGVQSHEDGSTPAITWWSEVHSFTSPPIVKADSEPFSYIVYGDQGCPATGWGLGGEWVANMTARELDRSIPIRSVHHFGDLSYAKGAAHIWDDWLEMISSFTPSVPLLVSVGNHEYSHTGGGEGGKDPSGETTPGGYRPIWGNMGVDSGGECGVPTANHFTMPESPNSNGVFWYSHDFANVHTIVLSSEHDLSSGSRQHTWLQQDLDSVDRTRTPWVIVEIHRPLYNAQIAPADSLVAIEMRERIEALLHRYKVDLVLAGHYHSYLRSCAGLYKGKCNRGGPTHITVGSAGAEFRHGFLFPNRWTESFIESTFGYGRITVANATALHFEFVQAGGADDPDAGRILDETWLVKDDSFVSTEWPDKEFYLREVV